MSHDVPRSYTSAEGPHAKVLAGCVSGPRCSLRNDFIVKSHPASMRLTGGVNYHTVCLRRSVSLLGRGKLRACYTLTAAS